MLNRSPVWLTSIFFAASLVPAQAQEQATLDTVLATVNGVEITAGHLLLMRATLPEQYQALPNSALYEGLLEQAIQQSLLAQQVETMAPISEIQLENEARILGATQKMQEIVADVVTEESLRAAYDEKYAGIEPTLEYNASHILVSTEDEAVEIKTLLDEGADFAETAQTRSTGPSGPSGGQLGWFGAGTMVAPFFDAVVALEPGTVSDPVQTQFGWHVILLSETRVQDAPSLEEVTPELEAELQERAIDAQLSEITASAEITRKTEQDVSPDFLSNLDLLQP